MIKAPFEGLYFSCRESVPDKICEKVWKGAEVQRGVSSEGHSGEHIHRGCLKAQTTVKNPIRNGINYWKSLFIKLKLQRQSYQHLQRHKNKSREANKVPWNMQVSSSGLNRMQRICWPVSLQVLTRCRTLQGPVVKRPSSQPQRWKKLLWREQSLNASLFQLKMGFTVYNFSVLKIHDQY